MTDEREELRRLQARVYGPHADLDSDPIAARRLRDLQAKHAVHGTTRQPTSHEVHPTDANSGAETLTVSPDEETEPPEQTLPEHRPRPRVGFRSTVLVVAALLVAAVIFAALNIGHRVQSAPLESHAKQVARLSPDPGYPVPLAVARSGVGGGNNAEAFQDFHGIRVVIDRGDRGEDPSMVIFRADSILDPNSDTFQGPTWQGQAAGSFPAIVQFRVTDDMPPQFLTEYHIGLVLQFVFDSADNEVVVFLGDPGRLAP